MHATTVRGLSHRRRELCDPANQHLFLGVQEQTKVRGTVVVRLREDAACPCVRVLEKRRGVAYEAQRLFPSDCDRFLRLDPDDMLAERRDADRLGDLTFPGLR